MGQKEKLNELQGKLNEIFDGIDDYYSQSILDELINRIESTINDFNKDFNSLIGNLNPAPAKRTTKKKTTPARRVSTAKKTRTASKAKSTRSTAKTLK